MLCIQAGVGSGKQGANERDEHCLKEGCWLRKSWTDKILSMSDANMKQAVTGWKLMNWRDITIGKSELEHFSTTAAQPEDSVDKVLKCYCK